MTSKTEYKLHGAEVAQDMSMDQEIRQFIAGYVAALKWSTSGEFQGEEYDSLEGFALAGKTVKEVVDECVAFFKRNRADLVAAAAAYKRTDATGMECAGHDFWLTRVGHGAGFWDGDLPKELGERLTAASKAFGERHPYVGDDGKIYQNS